MSTSPWSSTSATTFPAAPTVTATPVSKSEIDLKWNVPVSAATFMVEGSTNGGITWTTLVASDPNTVTTLQNTGLAADTLYDYRVTAINATSGASTPSTVVGATTLLAPVVNFNATAALATEMDLSWTSIPDATYFKIERSLNGTTWSAITATYAGSNDTYTDTGLTAATSYYYRISAIDASGTSATTTSTVAATFPAAPVVTAAVISPTAITLNWVNVATATAYKVEQSTNGGTTWTTLTSSLSGTPDALTGLNPNTPYTFRVSGINATGGVSAPSAPVTATTLVVSPMGLAAATASMTEVDLSWVAVTGATAYKIDYSLNGTTWTTISSTVPSTATTYANTGLVAGTTYDYRISTVASGGTSTPSTGTVSAVTLPAAPTVVPAVISASEIDLSWNAPL